MPRHFSSDEGLFGEKGENENKSFKVISNAGTEDRNASNIVEDVFIVTLIVVCALVV